MAVDEAQSDDGNKLTYEGQTWRVQTAPAVVETDGDWELVEVWVSRGEGIGESIEG
ncbi:hypothetical protein ABZ446_28585 [Streptomyces sp. NPDC005813]|uniref:hypothetical protein n=1 Tax=Streptomyces sp. NPDC005813 TaxID=3155592 RepID=UPI0033E0FD6D